MEIERIRPIKTAKAEQIDSLPEEIIEEILSRLPVKSLLKFRCVSKSWCSLIGSKHFIKAHLEKSKKNTNFTHHRIVLISSQPVNSIKQCSLYSLLNEPVTNSFEFDYPIYTQADLAEVVGCCNGLICILINRRQFFLWNPSTRMSKKLPSFDNKVRFGHIRKFGFGFDDANGDYMVFGFLTVFLPTGKIDGTGKVYSLNTNSWRLVKEKEVSPFDECGKFASGKLHWGRNWGLDWRWDIFSFDLMSGVHGKVDQPSYTEDDFYPTLGVLDGCICVICKYRETRLDVWILKEYGVKESWNRVAIVPYLDDLWKCRLSIPCCIGRNGEIVFAYGSIFLIYYPKDNEFRHPEVVNYDEFSEVNVHIESLVSLPT